MTARPDQESADSIDEKDRQVLILCEENLRPLYALQIGNLDEEHPLEFQFTSTPLAFTLRCLQTSPVVGLIDLTSVIRGKTEQMNRLFEFRVSWPVLRCNLGSDGKGKLMRTNPPLTGDFQESLIEMTSGSSAWNLSDQTRAHLRSVVRCRALIQGGSEKDKVQRVNVQNISRGGCLILTGEPPPLGAEIQIEIADLPPGPATLDARVVWSWQWQNTTEVPRAGLEFRRQQLPDEFLEALGDPEFFSELC